MNKLTGDLHRMLCARCNYWIHRFPGTTEFGDLYNEGWIVFNRCLEKYDPSCGTKFSTFFWKGLNDRFFSLSRQEWGRQHGRISENDMASVKSSDVLPDRQVMVKQFVDAVSQISPEFADMVVNGVPEELFRLCRRSIRAYRCKRGWDVACGEFKLNVGMVRKFFNVSFRKLRPMYYNSVE